MVFILDFLRVMQLSLCLHAMTRTSSSDLWVACSTYQCVDSQHSTAGFLFHGEPHLVKMGMFALTPFQ